MKNDSIGALEQHCLELPHMNDDLSSISSQMMTRRTLVPSRAPMPRAPKRTTTTPRIPAPPASSTTTPQKMTSPPRTHAPHAGALSKNANASRTSARSRTPASPTTTARRSLPPTATSPVISSDLILSALERGHLLLRRLDRRCLRKRGRG